MVEADGAQAAQEEEREEYVVVVTGSREWTDHERMKLALLTLPQDKPIALWHGNARGADRMADEIARELGYTVWKCPVIHERHGPWPAAGPRRNIDMLERAQPDIVLAFPTKSSKGTIQCITAALQREMAVRVFAEEGLDMSRLVRHTNQQ